MPRSFLIRAQQPFGASFCSAHGSLQRVPVAIAHGSHGAAAQAGGQAETGGQAGAHVGAGAHAGAGTHTLISFSTTVGTILQTLRVSCTHSFTHTWRVAWYGTHFMVFTVQ